MQNCDNGWLLLEEESLCARQVCAADASPPPSLLLSGRQGARYAANLTPSFSSLPGREHGSAPGLPEQPLPEHTRPPAGWLPG